MTSRRIAIASAGLAVVALGAAIAGASVAAPAPQAARSVQNPVDAVPGAAHGRVSMPSLPAPEAVLPLDSAPDDVIAYRRTCNAWSAVERYSLATYAAEVSDRACDVVWTPEGRLAAVVRGARGERVELWMRGGVRVMSVRVPGRLRGRLAVGERDVVFCATDRSGNDVVYRARSGEAAATPLGKGCLTAVGREDRLAWVANWPGRTAVLVPLEGGLRVADGVSFADFPRATILGIAWTGDAERVIAVVRGLRRTRAFAVDGGVPRLLLSVPRRDTIRVYPSPGDGRVVLVTPARNGGAVVRLVDSRDGRQSWLLRADDVPEVAWSPGGDEVLLADRDEWQFVDAERGTVKVRIESPGAAPAWCCRRPLDRGDDMPVVLLP